MGIFIAIIVLLLLGGSVAFADTSQPSASTTAPPVLDTTATGSVFPADDPSGNFNAIPTSSVAQVAAAAGFNGQDLLTAVAIAYAESGGNPNAVGDQNLAPSNGPSIGLWQINIGQRAHPQWASLNLRDPQINANKAFELYVNAGQQFTDWSTYNSGAWADYIDRASAETGVAA